MINSDNVAVVCTYKGNLMLFVIELQKNDYVVKKAVWLGKEDELSIHSIKIFGDSVYLADSYNNKIYKYNHVLNELNEETVGRDPRHMCISGENMYVANFESDNISVIDMSTFTLTESIPAGMKPHDVLCREDKMLYVCCYEENEVIECTGNNEQRHFTTEGKPMHMLSSDKSIILMTYFANGIVHTKINFMDVESGKITKVIEIEGLSTDFDIDVKRNLVYVINIEDKKLYVIDATKKETVTAVFLGGYPEGLTVGEKYVYITNSKKNNITVIDSEKLTIENIININFTPSCIKIIEDQK